MYAISTLLFLVAWKAYVYFSSIVEQLLKLSTMCISPLHGPRSYVDRTWERLAKLPLSTVHAASWYRAKPQNATLVRLLYDGSTALYKSSS